MTDQTASEGTARLWMKRAMGDSEWAAAAADEASIYLAAEYSDRRRSLAQDAQAAAQQAAQNAQDAEKALINRDYQAAIEKGRAAPDFRNAAIEAARLAAIDETELGRCIRCMALNSRFKGQARRIEPLADGTRRLEKRYVCSNCRTRFSEVYTYEGVLLERTKE